jgi:hypothetical protein
MKCEILGRIKVPAFSARRNQQLTVEDLQRMYGANWKAAAAHFGIEVEEEIW